MTELKHTTTPWWSVGNSILCGDENDPKIVCFTDNDSDVMHIGNDPDGNEVEECQANATFIVRACNAHDDLVAALEISIGYVALVAAGEKFPVKKERAEDDCKILGEALAKAKAQP